MAAKGGGCHHQFMPIENGVYHWAGATNGRTIKGKPVDLEGIDKIRKVIYGKFGYHR